MKLFMTALVVSAALVAGVPASAQIVNGGNGGNGSPPAPIGTKAGGSAASMQAPGEDAAVAGAIKNDQDFKAGQDTSGKARTRRRSKAAAGADTATH